MHGHLGDAVGGCAFDRQVADLRGDRHHFVEADPTAVPGARTPRATHGLVGLDVDAAAETMISQGGGRDDRRRLALGAECACQTLRNDAADGARHQERLDSHLDQPRDGTRRVIGMQRREDHVSGKCGLDRDLRRLAVADLTDHDDVGIRTHHRSQTVGEGQACSRIDLNLRDPLDLVLDRVLDRDDVLLDRVQHRHAGVQRRRLARAGRSRCEDRPIGPRDRSAERLPVVLKEAELLEIELDDS
ncbi:unannotated protein [freshwater metagenome]|uniref:Unannotated protein n=1 Tax=freshwater metagenome TaxID=449393 RepID=A0A6J7E8U5_9ZZZZ